jgi:hypothetical protein
MKTIISPFACFTPKLRAELGPKGFLFLKTVTGKRLRISLVSSVEASSITITSFLGYLSTFRTDSRQAAIHFSSLRAGMITETTG